MFRYLRVKRQPEKAEPEPGAFSIDQLTRDPALPAALRHLNALPDNAKMRCYRALLPPDLLIQFGIDPLSWKGASGDPHARLVADSQSGTVHISAKKDIESTDAFITIELSDNSFNGIDLSLLLLSDPNSPRFQTDYDEEARPTLFGTARRHLAEEERAMHAGLAPAQVRSGLGASKQVLQHLEIFLTALGHRSYFLEPLTYASAWIFERRGFAYVRGHKLMDDIHKEFQPGGRLHASLDASTPFRQIDQWRTVRGRAWAIHDGILSAIDAQWTSVRMVKQVGRHAQVETFPNAAF